MPSKDHVGKFYMIRSAFEFIFVFKDMWSGTGRACILCGRSLIGLPLRVVRSILEKEAKL